MDALYYGCAHHGDAHYDMLTIGMGTLAVLTLAMCSLWLCSLWAAGRAQFVRGPCPKEALRARCARGARRRGGRATAHGRDVFLWRVATHSHVYWYSVSICVA